MTTKRERIWKSLTDADYRREWAEEHVDVGLAFQVRALRDKMEWTQAELGERTQSKQATVSSWENPNYGKYTLSTLKKLAAAFDVGLLVRFVPFSELVDWTVDIMPRRLAPSSYTEESRLPEFSDVVTTANSTPTLVLCGALEDSDTWAILREYPLHGQRGKPTSSDSRQVLLTTDGEVTPSRDDGRVLHRAGNTGTTQLLQVSR